MSALHEVNEFIRGQTDCKKGIPHKENQSPDYDRGYCAQYELEQVNAERTSNESRRA